MGLFAVRIGYGLWVVRAADAAEAERVARVSAHEYGHEDDDAEVEELATDGPAEIVAEHYG